MPTHVTESTGASISAQWEFTTGSLIVSPTATYKADVIAETTVGAGVTVDGVLLKDGTVGVAYGGTGTSTAASARTALGVAASGANSDIVSLSGLTTALSVAQGGTGTSVFNAYGVVYASAATAVTTLAAGTSGQLLQAGALGVPAWVNNIEYIGVICTAPSTSLTAASDTARFQFPFNGYVSLAEAGVSTAPTGTTFWTDVWVNNSSIFSTPMTIDANETSTRTAATRPVIATATSAFSAWDTCRIHLNETGLNSAGLWVTLVCVRTS